MTQHRFHKLSDKELSALRVCQRIIRRFREEDSRIPSSYMDAFIAIALEPGKGPTSYASDLGTSQPMASRVLLEIGPKARQRPQALELVDRQQKPDNWREQEYFLTPKGRKLMRDLLEIIDPESSLNKPTPVQPDMNAATDALISAIQTKAREIAAGVVGAALQGQ